MQLNGGIPYELTVEDLLAAMPHATPENVTKFFDKLRQAMLKYEVNTTRRAAAFLAQIAHESGSLRYVEEIASGDAYEGRKDLGNTEPGDGKRFKGRGLIQITGRNNYAELSKELSYNFITNPEALEKPGAASFSAAWFWFEKGLNRLADIDAFEKITKRINGGLNGYSDRLNHWQRIRGILKVEI
jgi:putative chitinase